MAISDKEESRTNLLGRFSKTGLLSLYFVPQQVPVSIDSKTAANSKPRCKWTSYTKWIKTVLTWFRWYGCNSDHMIKVISLPFSTASPSPFPRDIMQMFPLCPWSFPFPPPLLSPLSLILTFFCSFYKTIFSFSQTDATVPPKIHPVRNEYSVQETLRFVIFTAVLLRMVGSFLKALCRLASRSRLQRKNRVYRELFPLFFCVSRKIKFGLNCLRLVTLSFQAGCHEPFRW